VMTAAVVNVANGVSRNAADTWTINDVRPPPPALGSMIIYRGKHGYIDASGTTNRTARDPRNHGPLSGMRGGGQQYHELVQTIFWC